MARIRGLLTATPWSLVFLSALWSPAYAAEASAADFYVRDLPGRPQDAPLVKMHAGHIEVTPEHHGNLFFWHFQNQHIANRQRTVIWINGGPGCSSEDGALLEIGPYRVSSNGNLTFNNGSWNEFANLLFVDNPVGTGFSFVDTDSYIHELDTMAAQFVHFLEKFFALFPEYERDDVYLAGESYAGQYIPYIAKAILDRNRETPGQSWSLKGLLIGNGWISPEDQYPAYLDYALHKGIVEKDSNIANELQDQQGKCRTRLKSDPGHVDYKECEDILGSLLKLTSSGTGTDACINMYDVRLKDSYPSCGMSWPPALKDTTAYLRRTEVTQALHVSPQKNTGWQECSGAVGSAFQAPNSKPSVSLFPELLSHIRILLFSGAEDLICSHMGTEQMLSKLEWNGGHGFEYSPGNWVPRRNWTFESEYAGFWQQARNLTYVLFEGASHMVAVDYPRRTRDMLDRFMEVDISSIGGEPTDSRLDGEKGPETTVGGASNHTHEAEQKTQKTIDNAKWAAYQRSGEVVLAIVAIAAAAWAYLVWRHRRKHAAYRVLRGEDQSSIGLSSFRQRQGVGDLEAAAFDETNLDDLQVKSPDFADGGRISLGDDSEEEGSDPELTPPEPSMEGGSKSDGSQHRSS